MEGREEKEKEGRVDYGKKREGRERGEEDFQRSPSSKFVTTPLLTAPAH